MENLKKNLINFFASFISSHIPEEDEKQGFVRKILKLKAVQEIVISCMCQLDPIINQELVYYKYPSSAYSLSAKRNQSRLLILASDIKNLMNNFENIQNQITSMEKIVNNLDTGLQDSFLPEEKGAIEIVPGPLMLFLSSISKKPLMNIEEIEEISTEA